MITSIISKVAVIANIKRDLTLAIEKHPMIEVTVIIKQGGFIEVATVEIVN